ncbi:MAG: DUF5009 domain-containing protein [Planctomycetes bacterium]|nr:DUF5009 domain-containing protein [Planctomycetota bacterium]
MSQVMDEAQPGPVSTLYQDSVATCSEAQVPPAVANMDNRQEQVVDNSCHAAVKPARLMSLDAFRGLVIMAMVAGDVGLTQTARAFQGNWVGPLLAYHTEHVEWVGCSFWDLIAPSFLFMVGVAMPYSHASRLGRGDSMGRISAHVLLRAGILVVPIVVFSYIQAVGVPGGILPSRPQSNFGFTHVLVQIGLAYPFVYVLVDRGLRLQLVAMAGIFVGYLVLFAAYPVPGPGWFAHWEIHTNAAAAFDRWFLNVFPRPEPFLHEPGGYQTLNFVPSMITMTLGLMAGELLRGPRGTREKFWIVAVAGVACLTLGLLAGEFVCPLVKRIWTPSWAVYSGGWALVMLAGCFWIIDIKGYRSWAFPLVVAGMNCITLYILSGLTKGWSHSAGPWSLRYYQIAGDYTPLVQSGLAFLALWLVCLWLYRRKLFLRL